MKDEEYFLKIEEEERKNEVLRIKSMQENGTYPNKFIFPITIQFELTSKCNLYCEHCYNNSSNIEDNLMSFNNWCEVINDINNNGGIFQAIISGGEPLLLGENLFILMDLLADNGTAFILLTNGFLLNDKIIFKLKKYDFYEIQISIDSLLPNEHDIFRNKRGSWEKAVNGALLVSSNGLPLRISHTILPNNIQYFEKFCEFCYQLGASSLVCDEAMISGRSNNKNIFLSQEERNILFNLIDKLQNKYKNKLNILRSANEYISLKYRSYLPNKSIIIRPNGDVRLDCIMPGVIGNVLKDKFSNIWNKYGSICWNNPNVSYYIEELKKPLNLRNHINYVTQDLNLGD